MILYQNLCKHSDGMCMFPGHTWSLFSFMLMVDATLCIPIECLFLFCTLPKVVLTIWKCVLLRRCVFLLFSDLKYDLFPHNIIIIWLLCFQFVCTETFPMLGLLMCLWCAFCSFMTNGPIYSRSLSSSIKLDMCMVGLMLKFLFFTFSGFSAGLTMTCRGWLTLCMGGGDTCWFDKVGVIHILRTSCEQNVTASKMESDPLIKIKCGRNHVCQMIIGNVQHRTCL
jgi:hypothetical protein